MKTQLILWSMFVVPWLTLFFMKKEHILRFMPLALLSALTSVIIYEMGISFRWWKIMVLAYPINIHPYLIGLFPVLTMWIFQFTFRKFWLFLIVEAVMNLGFDFLFLGFILPKLGILEYVEMSPIVAFCVTTVHSLLLYGFQLWQEQIFATQYRRSGEKNN